MNSKSQAILINNGSNGNTFYSNKLIRSNKDGLEIDQDRTSKNNVFSNNQLINSALPNNTISNPIHDQSSKLIFPSKGE